MPVQLARRTSGLRCSRRPTNPDSKSFFSSSQVRNLAETGVVSDATSFHGRARLSAESANINDYKPDGVFVSQRSHSYETRNSFDRRHSNRCFAGNSGLGYFIAQGNCTGPDKAIAPVLQSLA